MDIVIPTCGRWLDQPTIRQLVAAGIRPIVVVQAHEWEHYAGRFNGRDIDLIGLPGHLKTIAPTRQWIMENVGGSNNICMIDDDLTFFIRRKDDPTKLEDITPDQLAEAFQAMATMLSAGTAHVGFAAREGANRNTESLVTNTRIMRVLGYRRDYVRDVGARFDAMEVMEDFHVALCLLEGGYPNAILNFYAHNQAGSGKAGGCSVFRTRSVQSEAARTLAQFHPGFVSVTQKETKGSFGGGIRDDVIVQWKRAFASSQQSAR